QGDPVRRLQLLADGGIVGRDQRDVLLVDRRVPLRGAALLLDAGLVQEVVALVVGGEATFEQEPVGQRRRQLRGAGGVDRRIPDDGRRRRIKTGRHRRAAILADSIV